MEKVFKSIVEEFEIGFIKTHKLEILFESVKDYLNYEIDLTIIKRLDEVYISARYPSDLGMLSYGKPAIDNAKEFFEFARKIYKNIKQRFSEDDI